MNRYFFAALLVLAPLAARPALAADFAFPNALTDELASEFGESQRPRLERGLRQVAALWRESDGDQAAFAAFARDNFAGDQATLDTLFARWETMLEAIDGHLNAVSRALREQSDLDRGPILPLDQAFAGYDPSAHLADDLFANKAAFVVLLNFPVTTLGQRLSEGRGWTRRQWAEARLAQRFATRVPAEVSLEVSRAAARANRYIAEYNIWMNHVLTPDGRRLFPPKMRLLSHWNLRDEIKAQYREGTAGPERQRLIERVMERIVTQTIPKAVIDNPGADWEPVSNAVKPAQPGQAPMDAAPEPDTRYALLRDNYLANRKADPFSPAAPTLISRAFDENREIPEPRVREMLEAVVSSPLVPQVAAVIRKRLGRPLEPFDIWYDGFKSRGTYTEARLDEIVTKRYPTAQSFQDDIPDLLAKLGFSTDTARMVASHIAVDPARGSGYAWSPRMRSASAHLLTRVEKTGMNYKGFNVAMHELGHCVESVFSLYGVDHTLLAGVPNNAFTEALAFIFQGRDLELLGLAAPDADQQNLDTINDFWMTYEIAGVALVDMAAWRWMYAHPQASPAELKAAVQESARSIWNKYYAPVLGGKDTPLLAIYSHMINENLYLPHYPLGHMIAFQIAERMRAAGSIGPEFERMAR
ncbi:MAG: hypothetical protein PHF00_11605, partial [Elusimicrobia bacterium]|nr:hypothetical protein [Elusimicrobiota bacterium]